MKRVSMILAATMIIAFMSCQLCPAQEKAVLKIDKTITTTADTTTINDKDLIASDLYVSNKSTTDTLQFHTNNETVWSPLYSGQTIHFRIYVKNLFLKAKSGSGIAVTISNGDILNATPTTNNIPANCPDAVDATAYATSGVIKAGPGILYNIMGYNSKTSDQFLQIFNLTAVPANTTAPSVVILIPASSNFSIDYPFGKAFSVGICWSNSSTGATKTIGSADVWLNAQYK